MSRIPKYHLYEETFVHPYRNTLVRRFKSQAVLELWPETKMVKVMIPALGYHMTKDQIQMVFRRAFLDFNIPAVLRFTKTNGTLPWFIEYNVNQSMYFSQNITFIMKGDNTARLMQTDSGEVYNRQNFSRGDRRQSPGVVMKDTDWAEIYYALDSKIASLKSGFYGPDEKEGDWFKGTTKWIKHLEDIKDLIGPDGEKAVALGVLPSIVDDSF